jgi:hypothetical protein
MDYTIINVNDESEFIELYVNFEGHAYNIGVAVKTKPGKYYVRFYRVQFQFLMESIAKSGNNKNTQKLVSLKSDLYGKYNLYFYLGTTKNTLKEAKNALIKFMQSEPMLDLKKCLD